MSLLGQIMGHNLNHHPDSWIEDFGIFWTTNRGKEKIAYRCMFGLVILRVLLFDIVGQTRI